MKPEVYKDGVNSKDGLSLRVSVAALVSVLFSDPETGKIMLALERTAALVNVDGKSEVIVKAKPFGGGVRLINPQALKKDIGEFHYDSERSYKEQDFRIRINPGSWEKIKLICKEHLHKPETGILDPSPERELNEEFEDSLKINLTPDNYDLQTKGMKIEDSPQVTNNINAAGSPTVRVYYLYEARIKNQEIIKMIIINSKEHSDIDLQKMALEDFRQGGKGRANAVLSVVLDDLKGFYRSAPDADSNGLLRFGNHFIDGNVKTIIAP